MWVEGGSELVACCPPRPWAGDLGQVCSPPSSAGEGAPGTPPGAGVCPGLSGALPGGGVGPDFCRSPVFRTGQPRKMCEQDFAVPGMRPLEGKVVEYRGRRRILVERLTVNESVFFPPGSRGLRKP